MKVIIEIFPERKVVWAKMQNFKPDADVRAELRLFLNVILCLSDH